MLLSHLLRKPGSPKSEPTQKCPLFATLRLYVITEDDRLERSLDFEGHKRFMATSPKVRTCTQVSSRCCVITRFIGVGRPDYRRKRFTLFISRIEGGWLSGCELHAAEIGEALRDHLWLAHIARLLEPRIVSD